MRYEATDQWRDASNVTRLRALRGLNPASLNTPSRRRFPLRAEPLGAAADVTTNLPSERTISSVRAVARGAAACDSTECRNVMEGGGTAPHEMWFLLRHGPHVCLAQVSQGLFAFDSLLRSEEALAVRIGQMRHHASFCISLSLSLSLSFARSATWCVLQCRQRGVVGSQKALAKGLLTGTGVSGGSVGSGIGIGIRRLGAPASRCGRRPPAARTSARDVGVARWHPCPSRAPTVALAMPPALAMSGRASSRLSLSLSAPCLSPLRCRRPQKAGGAGGGCSEHRVKGASQLGWWSRVRQTTSRRIPAQHWIGMLARANRSVRNVGMKAHVE